MKLFATALVLSTLVTPMSANALLSIGHSCDDQPQTPPNNGMPDSSKWYNQQDLPPNGTPTAGGCVLPPNGNPDSCLKATTPEQEKPLPSNGNPDGTGAGSR